MSRAQVTSAAQGFTKPPVLRARVTVPRSVLAILVAMAWISTTLGRLHPVLVAAVPVVLAAIVFTTIYHVPTTHWVMTAWAWLRRRRVVTPVPTVPADEVFVSGAAIGVVSEHEVLSVLIELHGDPLAPTVATDTEERTANVLDVAELAYTALQVLDVDVASVDLISDGHRATGGFADLYQQLTGPTIAPAERRSWIVARIRLSDNMSAIDRRGSDDDAAQRVAAATCLRVADTLASSGIDARPATAAAIDAVNARLHAEEPTVDHWSSLESVNSFTGVYYADPGHIGDDAAQWWTWTLSRDVSTLIRITPTPMGNRPRIAALVRYRTNARTPAPPVSRLGPLYGVQALMWQQFRIGHLPCDTPPPSAPLPAAGPVVPFGPAGPLIGAIGDPRDHTAVHLPLVSPITVLCQNSLLLRQVALRSCVTGRPIVVVTDEPEKWEPIVPMAVSGAILTDYPDDWDSIDGAGAGDEDAALLDSETILVIDTDKEWPEDLPPLTILTADGACDADIELAETDDEFGFTLKLRTGLRARVRAMPAHEERRILGLGAPPAARRGATPPATAADRRFPRAGGVGKATPAASAKASPAATPPAPSRVAPTTPQRSAPPMRPVQPGAPAPAAGPRGATPGRHAAADGPPDRGPQARTTPPGAAPGRPTRPPAPNAAPPARGGPATPPPRPAAPAPRSGQGTPPPRTPVPAPQQGQGAPAPRPATSTQHGPPPARPAAPPPQPRQSPPPAPSAPPSGPAAPSAPVREEARPPGPVPSAPAAGPGSPTPQPRPQSPAPVERERHDWAAVAGRGRRASQGGTNNEERQRPSIRERWRGRQLKSTPPPTPEAPPSATVEPLPRRVAFTPHHDEEE